MSDFIYIAADGNYGDASGLMFVPADSDLDALDGDDSEITEFGKEHGANSAVIVCVTGEGVLDLSLNANLVEAYESLRTNYLDGEQIPDDEVVYELHLQGLTATIEEHAIPQVS